MSLGGEGGGDGISRLNIMTVTSTEHSMPSS